MIDCNEQMSQEVFERSYERVRYEISRFPLYDLRSAIHYLRKYRRKKYSVNQYLLRHFTLKNIDLFGSSDDGLHRGKHARKGDLQVSMVGDIMWMRKGWKEYLSEEVVSFLQGRDVVLGNLETPVSADHRVIEDLPDLFTFNSPPAMLDQLAQCFTAVSIINNHCLDKGVNGLLNTISELDARNILHAGAGAYGRGREYVVIRKRGCRIALLAYTWGLNNVKKSDAWHAASLNILEISDPLKPIDYSRVKEHMRRAREDNVDLVICSLHWGYEFEMFPTYPMMNVARDLIALGVDVIMGHHPHVLHPFELIDVNADRPFGFDNIEDRERPGARKAVIVYSLGNFVSAMYTRECLQSCIFNLDFSWNDGMFDLHSISYLPTYCMKKHRGKISPKVVLLLQEIKNAHNPQLQRELDLCYRDITEHLGTGFLHGWGTNVQKKC
ncbi:MAG TPA: CapA family protein [Nitrospirota bacterium]|nr:CapA family protein [Nitrospirota bacterium]